MRSATTDKYNHLVERQRERLDERKARLQARVSRMTQMDSERALREVRGRVICSHSVLLDLGECVHRVRGEDA